ncbi:SPOR domain-containing protein [Reinekea thalattae]|uniref:SPOR domain-containing protein n=1 Tax=Reinekea thalattae TaxID=2593301 RepID=A0A5C8Z8S1_9GAMM|nr:SPOR domain-containing protein [Reinekea thalattae]TXR54332.1 hypothetical protein FME95_07290 [Reinekea thalattae]
MARDYANKPKAKAAPRRTSRVPRWVMVFTLSTAAAFVGFLIYLNQVPEERGGAEAVRQQLTAALQETPATNAPQASAPISSERETLSDIKDKAETMRRAFEFYELLENDEVPIDLINAPVDTPATGGGTAAPAVTEDASWLIQVASFKSVADADRVRAQLILNGLPNTEIQSVDIAGQGTYHRVMVGPFNQRSSLNKAQDALAELNFDYLVKKL